MNRDVLVAGARTVAFTGSGADEPHPHMAAAAPPRARQGLRRDAARAGVKE
jgi:hypothetical protein